MNQWSVQRTLRRDAVHRPRMHRPARRLGRWLTVCCAASAVDVVGVDPPIDGRCLVMASADDAADVAAKTVVVVGGGCGCCCSDAVDIGGGASC